MKAWVLHGIGDIRFEDVQEPAIEADEVLVRVKAAGICGSDVPRVFSTGAHKMPLTPGHEFSGIVEGIGVSVDPIWTGKRVGVYPLIPCGKCECCKADAKDRHLYFHCCSPEIRANTDHIWLRFIVVKFNILSFICKEHSVL